MKQILFSTGACLIDTIQFGTTEDLFKQDQICPSGDAFLYLNMKPLFDKAV